MATVITCEDGFVKGIETDNPAFVGEEIAVIENGAVARLLRPSYERLITDFVRQARPIELLYSLGAACEVNADVFRDLSERRDGDAEQFAADARAALSNAHRAIEAVLEHTGFAGSDRVVLAAE